MTRNVFVSYCKEDSLWLDRIKKFIAPRGLAAGGLDLWDDTRIPPGSEWSEEIQNAITQSQCSLLLVSQDFLNSDFIWKHELPKLVELRAKGHAILWIPVRPSTLSRMMLGQLQALSPPELPLSTLSEPQQDLALVKIAEAFEKAAGLSLGDNPGGQILSAGQNIAALPTAQTPNQKGIGIDLLHTLIDRELQESPFLAAASNQATAAGGNILLLPYNTQDCLDLLKTRIERYTFPVRIKRAAQLHTIPWPRHAPNSIEGLRSYVSDVFNAESIFISPADVNTGSADEKTAIEAFAKKIERRAPVFWSDTQKDAPDAEQRKLLALCIGWWKALGCTETMHPLVLFGIRHRAPGALMLSALKDFCGWHEGFLDALAGPRLVEPPQPITFDDIDAWLNLDPVRGSYDMEDVRMAAEALFDGAPSLPMKKVYQEYRLNWLAKITDRAG